MSEPTLAALAAVGAPLLKEAEQALAPEAQKVLGDLREFVSGEADKLRTEFPAVVEQGVTHLHNLAEAMLARYHSVMDRIDAHLGGATPAAPASEPQLATGGLATGPVTVDPTTASSTTEASSTPSSTPSTSDAAPTDAPAA